MNWSFTTARALGMAALALGAFLLVIAYNASNAPVDQVSEALTGRYTDHTMWYVLAGIVAVVGGGVLMFTRKKAV